MTDWHYTCEECGNIIEKYDTLFDTLSNFHKGKKVSCPKCGGNTKLNLIFKFALWEDKNSKNGYKVKVIEVILPNLNSDELKWEYKSKSVEFYPFMVIVEDEDSEGKRHVWLPYWHLTKHKNKVNKKWGQFPPFIDIENYKDMIDQAKREDLL